MSSPLRIGIFVRAFPVPSETFIVTKVLGLLDAGFDVQIFTMDPSKHWDRFAVLQNRPDIRARVHQAPPLRPLSKALTVGLREIVSTVLRHPGDFARFMAHHWRNRANVPGGFLTGLYSRLHFVGQKLDILHIEFDSQALSVIDLKDFLGCKILLSARGTFQRTSVLDEIPDAPQRIYSKTDGFHFISEYLRQNAYKLGLPSAVQTWLIEPAIDLSLFANTAKKAEPERGKTEPLRVISVGRLTWEKGYEFGLDAVAIAVRAGVPIQYTIVGDGAYHEAIYFSARQNNLIETGIVEFAGAIPREQVVNRLVEADVMLHAALSEGFCNAVIEGQAVGLPIVTSDSGGLVENVEDGVTGFVVPRRNPEAMAEKLIQLASDPDLRAKMGKAGRERAMSRFNLTDQITAFSQLYHELGGKS